MLDDVDQFDASHKRTTRRSKAQQKQALALVGRFTNTRRVYQITVNGNDYKIECDETLFPGNRTDFEIEIELQNESDAKSIGAKMEHWLNELRIPIATTSGKASRFFSCLAKHNQT